MGVAAEHPTWLLLLLLLPLVAWVARLQAGSARLGRRALALAVRLVLLACLALALAGLQGVRRSHALTVVFLLDRSESLSPADQEAAVEWVRQALSGMPADDRAALVAFGQDALVERSPSPDRALAPLASVPLPGGTDIAAAIRLGLALLPGDTAGRLVLLSDGLETTGDAREAARLAAARGVEVDVVPAGRPPAGGEVRLARITAPPSVRQGQAFELTVVVESTTATAAVLQVLSGGKLMERRTVALSPGENRFLFSAKAEEPGFQRYEALIAPLQDTWPQNNRAAGFTTVLGPPRVLLVEGAPGEAVDLALALRAAGLIVEIVPPSRLPSTPEALAANDALFLVDVPAQELPIGAMPLLQSYVRDLGRGLAMVGGPASFGRGGYLNTPLEELLPVELRPRDRTQRPGLALVLVLDRSGSMGEGEPGGASKLGLALEAASQVAQTLDEKDLLGIVAFNTTARWVVPLGPVDANAVAHTLGGLYPDDGTSIYAGLSAARDAILKAQAPLRHVILLSDGWSEGTGYDAIVDEMAAGKVTSSIIAIGEDPASYLPALAERGGGRYFWVRQPKEIPEVLLEETITAMGAYIVEEPFRPAAGDPSPILDGLPLEALPTLLGYNGTWAKETAQVALQTHRDDPLLATWNYGLGRSAAWTSDMKDKWAASWVAWEAFPRFAAQLAGWLLPPPEEGNLQMETALDGRHLRLTIVAQDNAGHPLDFLSGETRLLGPELEVLTATLSQVAPGRYQSEADLPAMGAYMVQVALSSADGAAYRRQGGVVLPYSPEYRAAVPDPEFLAGVAHGGGGTVLTDPRPAFAHTLPPARVVRDWGPALLLSAALLLPLDVASRRLRLSWREVGPFLRQIGRSLARGRRPAAPVAAPGTPLLRAVQRMRRERPQQTGQVPIRAAQPPPLEAPARPTPPPAEAPASGEVMARLRQAKERARKTDRAKK